MRHPTTSALFYANDVLLASKQAARFQKVFNILMGIFDQVKLRTNMVKMVIMA